MDNKKIIVEVAMEIALTPELLQTIETKYFMGAARESAMSTSMGGIGPLLRERIIAEAETGNEIIGVTLLYEKVWVQRWQFWGQLYLEKRKAAEYMREVLEKYPTTFHITMDDNTVVDVIVWKASYGKAVVYFLECPGITTVVYPGVEDAPEKIQDKIAWYEESRIQQSWLLGRGTLALLKQLDKKPNIVILSETPTIFAWHKIIKDELAADPHFETTKYIFNDHTPLEYAHPIWSIDRMQKMRMNEAYYKDLKSPVSSQNKVDITQMIVAGVEHVYGVSALHGKVMRSMPTLKNYADKIKTITNGISLSFWQSPSFHDINTLSDKELLDRKNNEKKRLIEWVWKRYKLWSAWKERAMQRPIILWTRRITGYKRLDILTEVIKNSYLRERFIKADVKILLGGRIHQQDGLSKMVVFNLLDFLSMHPDMEDRIAMLDNYNVWEAPRLFHGIDATIMMSDEGKEASATGFMKAQVNGGVVIASSDGAIPESVVFYGEEKEGQIPNGFRIDYRNGSPTPETFLQAIETCAKVYVDEKKRIAMIRSAIMMQTQVSIERTVQEMNNLFNAL